MYPVIGVALAAAAAGASIAANEQTKRAMRNTVDAELARQRRYSTEASAIASQSLAESARPQAEQQVSRGQQARRESYQQVEQAPATAGVAEKSQSREVKTGTAAAIEQSDVQRAALMGWNDWLLKQQIKDIRAQRRINLLGGLSKESADILPYELQDAQHAGDALRAVGSVLGGAGQAVGSYEATRQPKSSRYWQEIDMGDSLTSQPGSGLKREDELFISNYARSGRGANY